MMEEVSWCTVVCWSKPKRGENNPSLGLTWVLLPLF